MAELQTMHFPSFDLIPQFKPSLRIEIVDHHLLLVLSERKRVILRGTHLVLVAPLIDGQRSVDDLVRLLEGTIPAPDLLAILEQLAEKGYLLASDALMPTAEAAFWELMGGDGRTATQRLATLAVTVESVGGIDHQPLEHLLQASAIRIAPHGQLRIVLTDHYLQPALEASVRHASQDGCPILLVRPTGSMPSIGPLIHPRHGSCLCCLQFWIRINHPVETMLARLHGAGAGHLPLALSAGSSLATYGLTASLVASLFALEEDAASLKDHLLTLDLRTLQTRRHTVVRRPQCPCCGDPGWMTRQAATLPVLQPVGELHGDNGGYRKRDPVQTFERYQHLISQVTGPVSYLHPMPRRHGGLRKVYVAGYMVSPQEPPAANGFDKICAGKGQTDDQARTSALCEALERFSGVYQGDEACVRGSRRTLGSASTLDFNSLQNFSERQYDQRDVINLRSQDRRRQIPERFDSDSVIDWTTAWSLTHGQPRYLPLTYCYAETPPAAGARYGIHNPNGAAAGNCLEEAVLQGLLELIERDAVAIWWYNQIEMPGLKLDLAGDRYFEQLRQEYCGLGWDLWVLNLSNDLGIPVCAALARHREQARYTIGFGCHLDPRLAVQRALTEMNQLFDPASDAAAPWDHAALSNTRFLFPSTTSEARSIAAWPRIGGIDLKQDIEYCIGLLAAHGMELLVIDKTRPDIGLNVVQVVVPGLRHFWPRFGPGRLYSVPVTMGWLAHEKAEDQLNQVALFL